MTPALIGIIPPSGIGIGPISIGFYGLGYVLAVGVLLLVSRGEAARRGIDPARVTGSLLLVGLCALVGARLYHVASDWARYADDPLRIVLPPYSGLGLYGGIAGAAIGIAIIARRERVPVLRALDIVIPGTLLAQGIARWGNFFNQELYGPPTDLPWAIAIDCAHRIAPWTCPAWPEATTGFHPLFLYESLLDLAGGLIALLIARRAGARLRDGDLVAFWMIWYGGIRIWLETFRLGWAWTIGGLPTASWIGIVLVMAGVALLARNRVRARTGEAG